ncbi:hypothetical protein [Alteromonas sp. H39]|uniref:hypothetical protein n=1 Tax=Alteromonas sp. H39 TaxID=3389876 RepID=UPI0039E10E5B
MSNDLLFSIIPRANNRVPVIDRGQIKRIDAMGGTETLNDEERALHNEERKVTEKEQYREHQHSGGKGTKDDGPSQDASEQSDSDAVVSYDESGDARREKKDKLPKRRQHIDKYV